MAYQYTGIPSRWHPLCRRPRRRAPSKCSPCPYAKIVSVPAPPPDCLSRRPSARLPDPARAPREGANRAVCPSRPQRVIHGPASGSQPSGDCATRSQTRLPQRKPLPPLLGRVGKTPAPPHPRDPDVVAVNDGDGDSIGFEPFYRRSAKGSKSAIGFERKIFALKTRVVVAPAFFANTLLTPLNTAPCHRAEINQCNGQADRPTPLFQRHHAIRSPRGTCRVRVGGKSAAPGRRSRGPSGRRLVPDRGSRRGAAGCHSQVDLHMRTDIGDGPGRGRFPGPIGLA